MTELFFVVEEYGKVKNCVYDRFGTVDITNSYKTNKRRGVLHKRMVDYILLFCGKDVTLYFQVSVLQYVFRL